MLASFSVSSDVHVQAASTRLFFCWAFAVSYFAMIVMISPLILKEIVGADAAAVWQGTLTSVTAGSGLILCSILGYLSDRYGRLVFIRLWVVCFFIASVGVVHAEMSKSLGGLVVARTVPFSVASALTFALASDIARDSAEVLKSHAALGATFSSAMLFGNVIAAGLGMLLDRVWILICGSCFVLVATYLAFNSIVLIKHHNKDHKDKDDDNDDEKTTTTTKRNNNNGGNEEDQNNSSSATVSNTTTPIHTSATNSNNNNNDISWCAALTQLRKDPLLQNLVIAYALLRCANVNSFSIFVLFVDEKFKWGLQQMATFLCLTGLIGALTQALVVRWMNSHLAKFTPLEAGGKVLTLFFGLLLVAPIVCFCYGFAPTTFWMFWVTVPGGIVAVVPAMFTSKIASLSKDVGLTGFSLGLVGSLQNLIETFLGVIWGKLLSYAIKNYEPTSVWFGLPYYVNAGVYLLVFVLVVYSHKKHGLTRTLWMENEVGTMNANEDNACADDRNISEGPIVEVVSSNDNNSNSGVEVAHENNNNNTGKITSSDVPRNRHLRDGSSNCALTGGTTGYNDKKNDSFSHDARVK